MIVLFLGLSYFDNLQHSSKFIARVKETGKVNIVSSSSNCSHIIVPLET